MRILALDIGEKNIGVAISDKLGWTAQGLPSIKSQGLAKDIQAISSLAQEQQASEIVVGMPVNLNGSLGKQAAKISEFIEQLKKKITLPIKVWDERLTSLQAEKVMLQADLSRKRRKRKIDQLASQLILQSYLDAQNRPRDVQ